MKNKDQDKKNNKKNEKSTGNTNEIIKILGKIIRYIGELIDTGCKAIKNFFNFLIIIIKEAKISKLSPGKRFFIVAMLIIIVAIIAIKIIGIELSYDIIIYVWFSIFILVASLNIIIEILKPKYKK